VLGDGVRDREGVDARDERGGVNDVIPRKLRGIVNMFRFRGIVHGFIAILYKTSGSIKYSVSVRGDVRS
jgi:hypothetical protein